MYFKMNSFIQVRVGAVSFSKTVSPQFGLGEYQGKEDMLGKIEQISYEGLGTNTAEALSYLYEKVTFLLDTIHIRVCTMLCRQIICIRWILHVDHL